MRKQILLFFVLAFLLNLFWEILHSTLYAWNIAPLKNDIYFYVPKILFSTLGDLLLIGIIFSLILIKNRNLKWLNKPSSLDYIIIIFLGIILAVFIEIRAIEQGKWFYSTLMPTLFGIGITPLFQLFTTFILALWLARN